MRLREQPAQAPPPSAREVAAGRASHEYRWLLAILLAGALLRLAVWHHRALDPDEGAQLMDGRFVLRGLVPFVDFGSRQVFYAWLMAAFIGVSGPDYARIRLFVVLTDVLNAALIFTLGRRLFDARVGLLAAAAYLFFPLAAGSGPIVHTESFAIFFACAAAYSLVRHLQGGGWGWLLVAGMLIAVGVYVRESGLAIMLGVIVTLAVTTRNSPRTMARRVGVLAAGFLIPCAGVALYYSRFLTAAEQWHSHLNPFYRFLRESSGPRALLTAVSESVSQGRFVPGPGAHPQPWEATWQVLGDAALVYGPLLAGAALSIARAVSGAWERRDAPAGWPAGALLYPWAISLMLAYGYWTFRRGFFAEYAIELVPALALLSAFAVIDAGRRWRFGSVPGWLVLALGGGVWAVLAGSHLGLIQIPRFLYLAVVPLVVSWPWLAEGGAGRRAAVAVLVMLLAVPLGLPASWQRVLKLAAVSGLVIVGWVATRGRRVPGPARAGSLAYPVLVVLGVAAAVLDVVGRPERMRPRGAWPRRVVEQIADTLRRRGRPADEVLSGGVIWEFQAGLEPFGRITHPLRFEFGIGPSEAVALAARMDAAPPRFIVFDGYTERTYGALLPDLGQVVRNRYDLVATARGGVWPVRLYQLRERVAP